MPTVIRIKATQLARGRSLASPRQAKAVNSHLQLVASLAGCDLRVLHCTLAVQYQTLEQDVSDVLDLHVYWWLSVLTLD